MESARWKLQPKHWAVITDDDCRLVLRTIWHFAMQFLDGQQLADYMIKCRVLTTAELSSTNQGPEEPAVNQQLLTSVEVKGKDVLRIFMEGLLETRQLSLYDQIMAELLSIAAADLPCYAPLPHAAFDDPKQQQDMATDSSDLIERMTASERQLLLCPVCQQLMSEPVLLACLHTCCRWCVPLEGTGAGEPSAPDYPVQSDDESPCEGAVSTAAAEKPVVDVVEPRGDDGSVALQAKPLPSAVSEDAATAVTTSSSSRGTRSLCPVCHEPPPPLGAELLPPLPNRFVAGCIAMLAERLTGGRCRRCADKGFDDVQGIVRCLNCACFLCGSCEADHDSFLKGHAVISVEAFFSGGGGGVEHAAVMQCAVHRCDLELFCEQCSEPRCIKYLVARCLPQRHAIIPMELAALRARDEIRIALKKLWPSGAEQLSTEAPPSDDSGELALPLLPQNTGQVLLSAYMRILGDGKRALLDVIDEAYEGARDLVEHHCQQVSLKASELDALVGHVISYCRSLLNAPSEAWGSLVEQLPVVLPLLQRLPLLLIATTGNDGGGSSVGSLDGPNGKGGDGGGGNLSSFMCCSDWLIVERLPMSVDLRAIIKELIGEPRKVLAEPSKSLCSFLATAARKGSSAATGLLLHHKAVGRHGLPVAAETAELKQLLSNRDAELAAVRSELEQRRRIELEDKLNELSVQLVQADEQRLHDAAELRTCRESLAAQERLLADSREAKSNVDYELKMLRAECDRIRGAGSGGQQQASWMPASAAHLPMYQAIGHKVAAAAPVAFASEPQVQPLNPKSGDVASMYRRYPSDTTLKLPPGVRSPAGPVMLGHGRGKGSLAPASPVGAVEPAFSFSSSRRREQELRAEQMLRAEREDDPASTVRDESAISAASAAVAMPSCVRQRTTLSLDLHTRGEQQFEWPAAAEDGRRFPARLSLSRHLKVSTKSIDVALTSDGYAIFATQKGIQVHQLSTARIVQTVDPTSSYKCVAAVGQQRHYMSSSEQSSREDSIALVAGNKSKKQVEVLSYLHGDLRRVLSLSRVLLEDNVPWCLAVDRCETAVAVGSGRSFHILHLNGRGVRLSLRLKFTVSVLAFSDAVLVVGSSEEFEGAYALEGRSKADPCEANPVWSRKQASAVCALHCDPHDNCYVLLARSEAVLVLSASTGDDLAEIALQCDPLYPLAFTFDADCRWLAVLLSDKQTTALFEFRGGLNEHRSVTSSLLPRPAGTTASWMKD